MTRAGNGLITPSLLDEGDLLEGKGAALGAVHLAERTACSMPVDVVLGAEGDAGVVVCSLRETAVDACVVGF